MTHSATGKSRRFVGGILIALLAASLCTCFAVSSACADEPDLAAMQAQASGTAYLDAAKAKYGISDNNVITVSNVNEFEDALKRAGQMATEESRVIMYVPSGTYKLPRVLKVPVNVLLVGESSTKFVADFKSDSYMMSIGGSVYGGCYDGIGQITTILRITPENHAGGNGIIEKAEVTGSVRYGISATYEGNRNAQMLNCKVHHCGQSGITVMGGAYVSLISNCKLLKNGTAGINISHADVKIIKNCTINDNGDKAVSTNSDPVPGYDQPGCTITTITGCTIKGNKTNGVYLKPKCTLKNFTNNTLINNKDGLDAVAKTVDVGTTGKSIIKNVSGNTFKGNGLNGNPQIRASYPGACITIGSGNKVLDGPMGGVAARYGGTVKITGDNNTISGNKGAAISAIEGGKLAITGKGNVVDGSKGSMAIYCRDNATITLKGVTVEGRIHESNGGKVKQS